MPTCVAHTLVSVSLLVLVDAKLFQNALYSDHMMLESREAYDVRPFVAGWGDTVGEQVEVMFDREVYTAAVLQDLTWEVQMNSCNGGTGKTLTVKGTDSHLEYKDVSCGQVFVCSGQSNMALPLSYVFNGTEEINAATAPNVRLFQVPRATATTPQRDVAPGSGGWKVLSPDSVKDFSAVCYLTAKHLSRMYLGMDFPIGLIESAVGGTRVEAWSPLETNTTCAHTAGPAPAPMTGNQAYSQLYNAMIAPLTRFSIRGAFWFQGEHNVVTNTSRERYGCTFGAMINTWRDAWRGIGDFPFLAVQLAPYTGYSNRPGHGDTSIIRLAQSDTLPHIGLDTTGIAVTIDLGDPSAPAGDVHSRHKEEVARRVALSALHVMYAIQEGDIINNTLAPSATPPPGVPLHFQGPQLLGATVQANGTTTLRFDFAGDAVMYLNDTLGCKEHRGEDFYNRTIGGECCKAKDTFQLCTGSADVNNTDTTYQDCANATSVSILDGGVIQLGGTAPNGATPTVVRHAYSNYPQCALYNSHGLPASPFLAAVTPATGTDVQVDTVNSNSNSNSVSQSGSEVDRSLQKNATPPMGVNSWNSFHCNVDERKMRGMADALVSTGLLDAGYNFLNVDDCWMVSRSANGTIRPDPVRFPGGIEALVNYAHSRGVKFGIYTAQKELTCQRRPGSYMHEAIDVQSYCDWGVDYIKLDQCSGAHWPDLNTSWIKFRAAIDKCVAVRGSPMVLSVESCGDPSASGCGGWIGNLANLWRTGGDIQATFSSVMDNAARNTKMAPVARNVGGPSAGGGGNFNDADMLQVGNAGLSAVEQSTHFSLWAIMMSPLLIGTDLTAMDSNTLAVLSNKDIIAVNQDTYGIQGVPMGHGSADPSTAPCWVKPLANGDVAVLLLNTGQSSANITCSLAEVGVSGSVKNVRDLRNHTDLGPVASGGALSQLLASHDHAFYRLTPA